MSSNEPTGAVDLSTFPIHLGLNATAVPQPAFSGQMQWYEQYGIRHDADGAEGRLVAMHTFDKSWESWEMHPNGSEVVVCIAGELTLLQDPGNGQFQRTVLTPGLYTINPPGVWHTADVTDTASALFITAGLGTQHRAR